MTEFNLFSKWSGHAHKLGLQLKWNTKDQCWLAMSSKTIVGEYFPLIEKGYIN